MHYYTFNIGDYMRDTAHLDDMEDLAYRRMLDLYYLKEMPLPKSHQEIAKLIRMRTHTESIANVLSEFFVLTDHGYVNSKADTTLNKIYDKSDKARTAAEKRWSKNKDIENADALQTHTECNADGMLPINLLTQQPINPNIIVDSKEPTAASKEFINDLFGKFWQHYKYKQGKQAALKAFAKFMAKKPEGICRFWMNLMLEYYMDCQQKEVLGYSNLHAATYINNKRWEDNPDFMTSFKAEWIAENGK